MQVTVTQDDCVKSTNKTIYIEEGSSIADFESIEMQIFPNPSSDRFTISTSPNQQKRCNKNYRNGHLKDKIPVTGETTLIETKGWKLGVYGYNLFVDDKLVKTENLIFQK